MSHHGGAHMDDLDDYYNPEAYEQYLNLIGGDEESDAMQDLVNFLLKDENNLAENIK